MMYSCDVFGISRQAYYKRKNKFVATRQESAAIIAQVQHHRALLPRIGTRKLYYLLGNDLPIGRDKLFKSSLKLCTPKHKTTIKPKIATE